MPCSVLKTHSKTTANIKIRAGILLKLHLSWQRFVRLRRLQVKEAVKPHPVTSTSSESPLWLPPRAPHAPWGVNLNCDNGLSGYSFQDAKYVTQIQRQWSMWVVSQKGDPEYAKVTEAKLAI